MIASLLSISIRGMLSWFMMSLHKSAKLQKNYNLFWVLDESLKFFWWAVDKAWPLTLIVISMKDEWTIEIKAKLQWTTFYKVMQSNDKNCTLLSHISRFAFLFCFCFVYKTPIDSRKSAWSDEKKNVHAQTLLSNFSLTKSWQLCWLTLLPNISFD